MGLIEKSGIFGVLGVLIMVSISVGAEQAQISVVPRPVSVEMVEGTFELTEETVIAVDGQTKSEGEYLAEVLEPATGFELQIVPIAGAKGKRIILRSGAADEWLGDEGYELNIGNDTVVIEANTPAGVFYGCQTIRQLLPAQIESDEPVKGVQWVIPQLRIKDRPRFEWRGSLMDCCRHFFDVEFVKRYIDLLAYHKMNRLHWHLTEDQGWRIEIKKYPKLTEIGAWRNTGPGNLQSSREPLKETDKTYGGYYTQAQIKDVVEYARKRHVMVVPEIEMPGHSQAALAAYPELACTPGPFEVKRTRGISKEIYCAGNEEVFAFLEDVLTEAMSLFDSPYIHIGGDEVPKQRWENCPKCQARMKKLGLETENQLQTYFIARMEDFLAEKGKRIIGWDEIIESHASGVGGNVEVKYKAQTGPVNLSKKAIVQSWRGMEGAIAAVKSGHDTIVSPTSHCYLDYPHSTTSLKQCYSFEPIPEGLTAQQQERILGGEGNVWTEHITKQNFDAMVFGRLTGLSEVFWSAKHRRNWEDFSRRMDSQYERLSLMGVRYYRGN